MQVLIGFDIDERHYARQISLESDAPALASLAQHCVDYLRSVGDGHLDPRDTSGVFLRMLRPRRVPPERSFVLGIFRRHDGRDDPPPRLVGVLYFLHPDHDPGTWYIPLLLLEPAARGQGLGSALHAAFACWSAVRGARRLVVAVSEANDPALRFWHERMHYAATAPGRRGQDGAVCCHDHELEHWLVPAPAAVAWARMRA